MLNAKRLDNSKGYVIGTLCYINIKELARKIFLIILKLLFIMIEMLKKIEIIIGFLMVKEKKLLCFCELDILMVRNK